MFKTIYKLTLREIKCLWKNKKALLILLVMPLVYSTLFGLVYSHNIVTEMKTAVVNNSPSQLSRSIVEGFNKSERFDIKYYLENEEGLKHLLEKGEIDVALIIPEEFTRNIKKGKNSSILIGVNASNSIIGNGAAAAAMQIVKTYSTGIVIKKFQAKGLLEEQAYESAAPINISFRPWFNPFYSYTNYLLLGIITMALQQILLMSVANTFVKEREENTLKDLLKYSHNPFVLIAGKTMVYFLATIVSLIITAIMANKLFYIPLKGSILNIILLGIPFFISIAAWGCLISVFCETQTQATQIAMLFAYPTFLLSGFTWPFLAMPDLLKFIAHLIPLTYFVENVRKIFLMGVNFNILKSDFISLSILACFYFSVTVIMFKFKNTDYPQTLETGKKGKEC